MFTGPYKGRLLRFNGLMAVYATVTALFVIALAWRNHASALPVTILLGPVAVYGLYYALRSPLLTHVDRPPDPSFRDLPYPVVRIADSGRVLDCNTAGCDLLTALGGTRVQAPADYVAIIRRVLASGSETVLEVVAGNRTYSCFFVPVLSEGFVNIYAFDITEHEQTMQALRNQEAHFRLLLANLPLMMFALDMDGTITLSEGKGLDVLGIKSGELVGQSAYTYKYASPASRATIERVMRGESLRSQRDVDGIQLETVYDPLYDADGVQIGVIGISIDTTELHHAEETLQDARDQALEASRLKSEFLATISHELRTPMNGIMGMTELLQETALDERQKEYAGIVLEETQHLMQIIDAILDFTKIEAGRVVLEKQAFDPGQTVENVVELLAPRAHNASLTIIAEIDPDVPRRLLGDAGRMRQVLLNLIGNAIKFTEKGEIYIHTRVESRTDTRCTLHFTVRDTGIGLSEVARQRLFQPFTQADGSATRRYGGTGLGLVISHRLVEIMGGAIGVDSEEGRGSTFWFTAAFDLSNDPEPDPLPSLNGMRVLVADANNTRRGVLVRTLLVSGARCSAAADAETALRMLQRAAETDPYHALVTTAVPGSAILAAEAGTESVPVLLITPSFQPEWEGRCAAHLMPPVRREALILALNAAAPQAAAPVTRTSETVDEPPPVRGRVLVAEDNPANQRVARFQLEHLGMRVDIVADGRQALHLLEQTDHSYDLALMDCQMPEMDGYEATRAIRTAEGATQRHIPIIAMTAGALKRDLDACIEAGMDDYITKPVIVETLRTVLDRWLVPAPMRDTSAPD